MLFGIKRKTNKKERKNYELEESENIIEQLIDNIAEVNKPDVSIGERISQPIRKVNINFGYDDEHNHTNPTFIGKKRANCVKIYDEDDMPYRSEFTSKTEESTEECINIHNKYEYKFKEDIGNNNYTITDMDLDNYDHSAKVGDGIYPAGVIKEPIGLYNEKDGYHKMTEEYDYYDNYVIDVEGDGYNIAGKDDVEHADLKCKIDEIKRIKEQKRIMEPKDEQYDQDYIELKNFKTKELIDGKEYILI
jgi:hypothetical protein